MDSLPSLEIHPRRGKQIYPAVTFNGQNYVVVWGDKTIDTTLYYVVTTRVSPAGVTLDSLTVISNPVGSSDAVYIDCAFDGNRCLAIWPQSNGIYGRFINQAGQPEGSIFSVNPGAQYPGNALVFGDSAYLVVWHTGIYPSLEIYGQLVSPQGNLVGPVISIALGSECHRWPKVAYDGNNYLVIWMTGPNSPAAQDINGQFISRRGARIGGNFRISESSATSRWWPSVAASDSNYLVVWQQGSGTDLYGNIDTRPLHIADQPAGNRRPHRFGPTVFSRSRLPVDGRAVEIYDITGRPADPRRLKPGIYFVEVPGRARYKIIKAR